MDAIRGMLAFLLVVSVFACIGLYIRENEEQIDAAYQEGVEQASEALAADKATTRSHFMERVGTDKRFSFTYYRDVATDVMYIAYHPSYGGGVTMMYHPNGSPLLYSEWVYMFTSATSDEGDG